MIKVMFNDDDAMHDVEFSRSGHLVTLRGINVQNTSGFTTWRADGITQLGDFTSFNTVYRVFNDAVQYSDDGSVFVEPDFTPDVVVPTPNHEERITALENQLAAYEAAYQEGVNEA